MTEENKELLKSIGPLLLIIILFVVVAKIGISQIGSINKQLKDAKKTQTLLTTKINTLRSTASISETGSEIALAALPNSNPSINVMSQLKFLSSQYPVIISNIKSSYTEATSKDLTYVSTSFDLSGTSADLLSFINALERVAPITLIQKISITSGTDVYDANIVVQTYYAPLPSTIPSVTQPVNDLTAAEKELLNKLSSLVQPVVLPSTVVPTAGGDSSINPNPFGI